MPLPRTLVLDQGIQRPQGYGDVVSTAEPFPVVDTTVGTYNIPVNRFVATLQNRSAATVCNDVLPDSTSLIAAMGPVALNTTFRHKLLNAGAAAITVTATANTGVTVASPTVNAGSVKDFLVTLTNTTPATALVNVSSTNASPTITNVSQAMTDAVSVGMKVSNNILGLQGTTIIGIVPGVSITFSANANATSANQTINLIPTYTVQGLGQGLV